MKAIKKLKPGSVPSLFPFMSRKPERELSQKRLQKRDIIREKIAKDEVRSKYVYKLTYYTMFIYLE